MSGWNQVRPNHPMQMNQTPPVMGGGNMMMGNYGMNQSYQMSGGQMMYQQPYMQQAMYQQPMMNAYGNMAVNAQVQVDALSLTYSLEHGEILCERKQSDKDHEKHTLLCCLPQRMGRFSRPTKL